MTNPRVWMSGLLAAVITVLAGRWGVGLFAESEFVHFSVNFPTAPGMKQIERHKINTPWSRILPGDWKGYPTGGLLAWGREGRLIVNMGNQGILKQTLQPWVLLLSSHWIRNIGVQPYRVRLEFDACNMPVKWETFERDWDEESHTITRDIQPGKAFNMDWIINIPNELRDHHTICKGGLRLVDAHAGDLLTFFPISIINSAVQKDEAR
ncbi:MAG: hypothetical protein GY847_02355 [Proteobacteria bacterium]|nr:hypothetical protein [Pseudomonadota bacterium]